MAAGGRDVTGETQDMAVEMNIEGSASRGPIQVPGVP